MRPKRALHAGLVRMIGSRKTPGLAACVGLFGLLGFHALRPFRPAIHGSPRPDGPREAGQARWTPAPAGTSPWPEADRSSPSPPPPIAAQDPVAGASRLRRDDPAYACEHGQALIAALVARGDIQSAVDFAVHADRAMRTAWVTTAFARWAAGDPAAAAAGAARLADGETRAEASEAVLGQWAARSPAELAEHALRLPNDFESQHALETALGRWVRADAVAASVWLSQFEPAPQLDRRFALVAQSADVQNDPLGAVGWAEDIVDSELRASTLSTLIRAWSGHDRAAAYRYAVRTPSLSTAQRAQLLSSLPWVGRVRSPFGACTMLRDGR